jgi:hypothetical protein
MDKDYLKYLNTEKEISEFKINYLKKMLHKGDASTKRLLAIEEEFVQIPFEKLTNSLSDLLSAIKVFRESRNAFYDLYPISEEKISSVENYFDFIKDNLKYEIKKFELEIESSKIKLAREKSRTLIILLCIFVYLEKNQNEIKKRNLNINELDLVKEISKRYLEDIFSFYNEIILTISDFSFLSEKSKLFLSEVKCLVNLVESNDGRFLNIKPERIRTKSSFGFYLNSKHSGRETLRPYYMSLYDDGGDNISKIFSLSARASILNGEYYKFISLLSPEELKDNIILLERYENLMKKIFHLKLSGKPNLKIDEKKSLILVPASRTEDEGIKEALNESSAIFSNILKSII